MEKSKLSLSLRPVADLPLRSREAEESHLFQELSLALKTDEFVDTFIRFSLEHQASHSMHEEALGIVPKTVPVHKRKSVISAFNQVLHKVMKKPVRS